MRKIVAYISIVSSYSHSTPVYGQLRALTEAVIGDLFEWKLLEYSINENSDSMLEKVISLSPTVIISTAYLFNIEILQKIFKKIFLLMPETVCIMGGPEFLGDNQSFLSKNRNIVAVFRGDESSLPLFLKNYRRKKVWTTIKGVCFIDKNNNYIDNGIASFNGNLDDLPSPYEKGYFQSNKPFIHYETARGCLSMCSFCVSSISSGVKFHSKNRVETDLNILRISGIREIRILDRTFNVPEKRAIELIKLFASKFTDIKFHIEIDPAKVTNKLIETLNAAPKNQFHIEAGVQTYNRISLKNVGRTINIKRLTKNLNILVQNSNYKLHADIISGLPKQKYYDSIEDLNKLVHLGVKEIQLEILKILPGTPIIHNLENGTKWSPYPPYEVLCTADISFEELYSIKILSRIIDSYYNVDELRSVFRFAAIKNPHFLYEFPSKIKSMFALKDKPSLTAKLNFLFEYAELKEDKYLYDMITFTCCINGYFPKKINNARKLKSFEVDAIKKSFNTETIWQKENGLIEEIIYFIEYNFNAGEILLNPTATLTTGNFSYLFYYPRLGLNSKAVKVESLKPFNVLS